MTDLLQAAVEAAHAAGELIAANRFAEREVDAAEAHDIKLALAVRAQALITERLPHRFPEHAILGEEGSAGNPASPGQWIVDPIDGTVNFYYGLPHFCVSIALRQKDEITVGVVHDPVRHETWTATADGPALLNGTPCAVSPRDRLGDAILTVGFAKTGETIGAGMPLLEHYVHRVRKCRMMGSAALDLAYVACGRLDAYIEQGVSEWDIAAGRLLVERAGGRFEYQERPGGKFAVIASSGRLDLSFARAAWEPKNPTQ